MTKKQKGFLKGALSVGAAGALGAGLMRAGRALNVARTINRVKGLDSSLAGGVRTAASGLAAKVGMVKRPMAGFAPMGPKPANAMGGMLNPRQSPITSHIKPQMGTPRPSVDPPMAGFRPMAGFKPLKSKVGMVGTHSPLTPRVGLAHEASKVSGPFKPMSPGARRFKKWSR